MRIAYALSLVLHKSANTKSAYAFVHLSLQHKREASLDAQHCVPTNSLSSVIFKTVPLLFS